MTDHPFSEPLASGLPEQLVEGQARLALPWRMGVARRAVRRSGGWLLWVYTSWLVFLAFVIGVTLFETLTGESVSLIGGVVQTIVSWSDVLWPYNYPLGLLSLIVSSGGLVGAVNGVRLQSLPLARMAGHIAYLPLLGPWLGLFAVLGVFHLRVLGRAGVAGNFDGQ
ncbi:hypothetical protein [Roseimaritima ulvae]|uniref:Uncharacterized protein n=1 Tax=Roseimaritima ulvae TaxID=980254 RepID=A0A5B9QX09_9BACT|nr:hypothetical protein [Roseimaritima ulvae]QEG42340.1 hypothetical protein UC8_43740 [Roseimaritima ulvae]